MKRILLASAVGFAGMTSAQTEVAWPSLPKDNFVSGRSATESDFESGRAVFVVQGQGATAREPVSIAIPQYAYAVNGGQKTPIVIVQAEYVRGAVIIGARTVGGPDQVLMLGDVELLGTQVPVANDGQSDVQAGLR